MKIFRKTFQRLADALIARVTRRAPDFVIGGHANPYLLRWWLIPRNPLFNIYLHKFLRDDDDRALHDHPWFWCSILLRGEYVEVTSPRFELDRKAGFVTIRDRLPKHATVSAEYALGGSDVQLTQRVRFKAGAVRFRRPKFAHRIELFDEFFTLADFDGDVDAWRYAPRRRDPVWTLFITGPRVREWGFHCPGRGWVPWQQFTASDDPGAVGKGCDA